MMPKPLEASDRRTVLCCPRATSEELPVPRVVWYAFRDASSFEQLFRNEVRSTRGVATSALVRASMAEVVRGHGTVSNSIVRPSICDARLTAN
jgi:hypothetical protein